MKKFLLLFFLIAGFHPGYSQKIEPRPVPPTAVNDFGNMLEPFQKQALEQKLRNYNDSTSSAIVIVTVNDLQGYDIAEVALKYLRDWGIGKKEKDNGVLILVSKTDRKARIETGFGMEGVLPDILAKQIRMIPAFKENDYYRGFDNAVDAIIQAAAGEYKADPASQKSGKPSMGTIVLLVIIFVIILKMFSGGGGGGGGSYMSRKGSKDYLGGLPWFLLGSMLGGGGRGGGGGFGGGGFGGGGGGFGGFGGGGGGGGGASGGW